ncbi:DUF1540 domain-containing protein [Paenibacillus sp. SYP-B3998]|uniref:DUF1540 domain-containing protein n=1 Tax=Paenibacillus sp. SYP-B3998 TaxID=2678564 RepID=A0A6G3ZSX7_9BACL|nr:DUF1540 domain-containing protein [Paenibacillus sp. SYP-B3998]NEW05225.1 DUF1540 domain-containing protein [Paenibacillus sp. SYP-B3998]
MPDVKCAVANCEYWTQGNRCNANSIMIEVDQHATANYKEEFAGESFGSDHQDAANKAASTCCHTFEFKKSK